MNRRNYNRGINRKIKGNKRANTPRLILIFIHSYSPELPRDTNKANRIQWNCRRK
jgi:hypothetical protein